MQENVIFEAAVSNIQFQFNYLTHSNFKMSEKTELLLNSTDESFSLIAPIQMAQVYVFVFATFPACLVLLIVIFPFYVYVNRVNRERDENVRI